MKSFGRTSISEYLGDLIVYRNLEPLDPRLPPLEKVRAQVGLATNLIPRKSAQEYAQVIVHLLDRARELEMPGAAIERLVYVGDTRLNDGTAFVNICRAGEWPGLAFIGAERDAPLSVEVVPAEPDADRGEKEMTLFLANRWAALADFDHFSREQGFPLDASTAVIVDLDKTALGARGRNDHVIDRARVEAVRRTVGDLLGEGFDSERFQKGYDLLNQTEFHPFTTDNQDYLAYICLILGSGLFQLDLLLADIRTGRMATFEQFIARVDRRAAELPPSLQGIHRSVYASVQEGDPTPFKPFRYNEYRTTVECMGCLDDGVPARDMLMDELVITQEVREVALAWKARGALLFGLSDKPDEASIPAEGLKAAGFESIHRVMTHSVGG